MKLKSKITLLLRPSQRISFLQAIDTFQYYKSKQDGISNTYQKSVEFLDSHLHRYDYILIVGGLLIAAPVLVFASNDPYGTQVLTQESTNLKNFLFGPVLRIAGVVGAVFGIIRSFQTQSLQPIFIFGGIGAATVIVPKLLDVMFKI